MKILQINSVYKYGSTGRIADEISIFMKSKGNDSFIAYGRGIDYSTSDSNIFKFGNQAEQISHVLLTRIFDRHGFGSKKSTLQLTQIIDSIHPDIIMIHNIHGYYLNIKILFNFISKKKIPVIWLFHDAWPISGHSAHFELTEKGEIPVGNTSFKQRFEYPMSVLFDQSKKNYLEKKKLFTSLNNLTIVTPSMWLSKRVKQSFFHSNRVETIYNGIDTNVFKIINNTTTTKICNIFQGKKIILGVASVWTKKKGFHIFNELAEMVSEEYQIIMIGVSQKIKRKLNNKIYAIQRTENIEELVQYYNAAYVFVNPTFEDNFPTTNIEALACGTPIITFDTGGCSEAIDKRCGIITQNKTVQGIIKALAEMKEHPFYTNDCRIRGEKFSKENMLLQYQTLLYSITKGEKNEY